MDYRDEIAGFIEAARGKTLALSDEIWGYAEPRFQEYRSAAAQKKYMAEQGFRITEGLAGEETAFLAEYGSGKPVVAILGEYDALSGLSQKADSDGKESAGGACGHGCGHNLLGAASAAAAAGLKSYLEARGLPGTVRYYGCPAEENAGGKAFLVRDGCFGGCDAAITWHPSTINMVRPSGSLANFRVFFTFRGTASHAAAAPELGRSALDAVELMDVGVNYMREHMSDSARIHYAIIDAGGTAPNVVQARAQVLYAIRAPKVAEVKELYKRVCAVARGAALMTETEVDIRQVAAYSDFVASSIVSEELGAALEHFVPADCAPEDLAYAARYRAATDERQRAAEQKNLVSLLGRSAAAAHADDALLNFLIPMPESAPSTGSTDVGDVSWVVPTGQFDGATWAYGTAAHSWQAAAQGKSGIAHGAVLLAAKVMACAGARLLTVPGLAEKAREEWLKDLNGETYPDPLPAGARPEIW